VNCVVAELRASRFPHRHRRDIRISRGIRQSASYGADRVIVVDVGKAVGSSVDIGERERSAVRTLALPLHFICV